MNEEITGVEMREIINVRDYGGGIEEAIKYIHGVWGSETNYDFYYDAIFHSTAEEGKLPRFYLMLDDGEIIGCAALLINDLISRQDLYPWFACLFVDEKRRGKGLGNVLMRFGEQEARRCGFRTVYLTTDHDGYYEKYGWKRIEDGYELTGKSTRIYMKELG